MRNSYRGSIFVILCGWGAVLVGRGLQTCGCCRDAGDTEGPGTRLQTGTIKLVAPAMTDLNSNQSHEFQSRDLSCLFQELALSRVPDWKEELSKN